MPALPIPGLPLPAGVRVPRKVWEPDVKFPIRSSVSYSYAQFLSRPRPGEAFQFPARSSNQTALRDVEAPDGLAEMPVAKIDEQAAVRSQGEQIKLLTDQREQARRLVGR